MFLFHVPCLSSSVRNVDNQNARNCVEIITGVVRCLGHCGTWCVMSKPNNGWQREDRLARKIHSRLGRQHKLRLQGRGKLFLSSAPFPSSLPAPCEALLFNNTAAATQQLPSCNSVPQCQVMQPQILFLSISQYIHNSSSGRYNGFRETLDRGNSIMCRPELTSTHVSWLVSTEACRSNL